MEGLGQNSANFIAFGNALWYLVASEEED